VAKHYGNTVSVVNI